MKTKNFAMLAGVAVLMAACGGSATIDPVDVTKGAKVYYGFNSAEISEEARANLMGQALFLKANDKMNVQVAGNCDERGTTEYNLALGQRRASAAKSVLVSEGVDANRISTISYGKERPDVKGSGESVWKFNRNATTTVK